MPDPYSHGYLYGGTFSALGDDPYPADMQSAAETEHSNPATTPTRTPRMQTPPGA